MGHCSSEGVSGDNKIDIRGGGKEKKISYVGDWGGGEIIRLFFFPIMANKKSALCVGSLDREGLPGWSAGLREHPGQIKEQLDAILPAVMRGCWVFLWFFGFLFFVLLPRAWRQQSCPPEEELVGTMPLQESHPWGKGGSHRLQRSGSASRPGCGDRYKTGAAVCTGAT